MTIDLKRVKIYMRPGSTDLRKGVNGLAVMVEGEMKGLPLSGNVYVFCNRERRLIKALWWDRNGFWLSQKRLEKDKYPWPERREDTIELEVGELEMLLRGIDFFKAHKPLYYEKVSWGRKKDFTDKRNDDTL